MNKLINYFQKKYKLEIPSLIIFEIEVMQNDKKKIYKFGAFSHKSWNLNLLRNRQDF